MKGESIKGLKHFKRAVGQNCFHFVWKCKYAMDPMKFYGVCCDVERFIREACERHNFEIYELSVQPDHVHLFCDIPPSMNVSKALQLLKGYSSYALLKKHPWLRRYFRKGHFWSPGKFFRSVGNVTSDVIQNYIKFSQGNWQIPSKVLPSYHKQRKLSSFVA